MIRRMACCASFEDGFSVLGVLCVAAICFRKYERRDKCGNLSRAFHRERPF
jgi:hypothetical protein